MEKKFDEKKCLNKEVEGKKCYETPDGDFWFSDEEWEQLKAKFFGKYPDCPKAEELACLELSVGNDVYEAIKDGRRKAVAVYGDDHVSDILYDKECVAYINRKSARRDEWFANWSPILCNGRRPVRTIKFICGEETMTVTVKEQGWTYPFTDDVPIVLRDEYGCPEVAQLIEERYTVEAYGRRIEAGEDPESVFSDEFVDYHYFIF